MEPSTYKLRNGLELVIREATGEDAGAVLEYVQRICGETDFLRFGPGEFGLDEQHQREFWEDSGKAKNKLFILVLINGRIVSVLNFAGGQLPRVQHAGEFGLTVQRRHWGSGIGALMLDALVGWAKDTHIVKKINLRVRMDNKPAIRLYERKGFVKEGTIRKEFLIDGKFYDAFWMGLELPGS